MFNPRAPLTGDEDMDQESLIQQATLGHRWETAQGNMNEFWEFRDCKICGLRDKRHVRELAYEDDYPRMAKTVEIPNAPWLVTTPCIQPVPERISLTAFMEDLAAHDCLPESGNLVETLVLLGHKTDWTVGLIRGGLVFPVFRGMNDLESGLTFLLRWIRARQYRPSQFPDYISTDVEDMDFRARNDSPLCCH